MPNSRITTTICSARFEYFTMNPSVQFNRFSSTSISGPEAQITRCCGYLHTKSIHTNHKQYRWIHILIRHNILFLCSSSRLECVFCFFFFAIYHLEFLSNCLFFCAAGQSSFCLNFTELIHLSLLAVFSDFHSSFFFNPYRCYVLLFAKHPTTTNSINRSIWMWYKLYRLINTPQCLITFNIQSYWTK